MLVVILAVIAIALIVWAIFSKKKTPQQALSVQSPSQRALQKIISAHPEVTERALKEILRAAPSTPSDSSMCRIIVSNPYIPSYKLTSQDGFFYTWFYNMIQGADKWIYLCNTYLTLFKHQSENPEDYQSQIYYALVNALNRGVSITCVNDHSEQQQCQIDVATQEGLINHLYSTSNPGGLLKYADFSTSGYGFFHDKIYMNEKIAYVGGQNLSGSSSIDVGIEVPVASPLYKDLYQRVQYLASYGTSAMNFTYTVAAPYVADSGANYFISLSPFFPVCENQQGQGGLVNCQFPQQPCLPPTNPVGPFVMNKPDSFGKADPWHQSAGNVSYEWHHLHNLISNAKKSLVITNYDWSVFGDVFSLKMGSDWGIATAIADAVARGVQVDIWISSMPMSDTLCDGNTTCNALRCTDFNTWLANLQKSPNFSLHWWYQNPAGDSFNDNCHVLHGKIYYSDWGFLISSSNFTPQYFAGTQDTGFCGVFNGSPPTWVSSGIDTVIGILKSNSTSTYNGKKYVCDNASAPNFQTVSDTGKSLCTGTSCKNTCIGSPGMWPSCSA